MKLLCLDSNSILNRAFYGVKLLTTRDGTYTNAIFGFMNILGKLLSETQPDAVVFAFDLKAKTFRHQMYDGYKAQRKGMPEELAQQLPLIKELLTDLGYRIVTKEGYEADDILGTFAKKCEEEGHQCFIATGDRDSLQLVSDSTTVLLAHTKMGRPETLHFTPDKFREEYGTEPKGLIDIKALMGDTSDNIPGVKGIGEKTAKKLIAEYGNIDTVYEQIETIDVTKSVREKLRAGKDDAYMSRTLATIDQNVPLDVSIADCVPGQCNEGEAFALLTRLEMNSIIKKLGLKDCGVPVQKEELHGGEEQDITATINLFETVSLEGTAPLAVVPQVENENVVAVAVCDDDSVCLWKQEDSGFEDNMKGLFTCQRPLVVYDSKSLYHWAMERGIQPQVVKEDVLLSAYLLSATASSYELPALLAQYPSRSVAVEGGELLAQAAKLCSLAESLRKEIEKNGQSALLDEIELPLARVLASMELLGVEIDAIALQEYGIMLDDSIEKMQNAVYELAGEEFNINSPKQLGEILFEKLGLPARKKTKTGYSTNAEILEALQDKHPIIPCILEYRKVAKLKSTYVDGLKKVIGGDQRIHSHFNQTDTRTGRLSSTEPNLQNIPVRTELGAQMRRFFRAQEGWTLVDADYSQIELRVLAHIADDKAMQNAFNSGEDIHTNTAAQVFDLPPLFVTPDMRRKAKAVNFGIVYGIGAFSLAQDIGVSVAEADRYIKNYLRTFSGVQTYMEEIVNFGKEKGYVETLYGRRRYLPELSASNKNIQNFGKRVAMNTPIQGTAADIIKIAMIRVYDRLAREERKSRLILQIHDELIVETAPGEEEAVQRIVKEEMEAAASLKVKLSVDAHCGRTWFDAK
ncbi:MAG: DNA polymerase I [Oscillospiraceae bacterium]|nr:DNA polymerase I [Oscillospiraceae bacterium]